MRTKQHTRGQEVFLSAYHLDGNPIELVAAHQRLLERFPLEEFDLHLCVTTDTGSWARSRRPGFPRHGSNHSATSALPTCASE